jgi:hypothetical protein
MVVLNLKVELESLLGSDAPHSREIHNCLGLTADYYHRTTFLQLTTFFQFRLASSNLPQPPYFFD